MGHSMIVTHNEIVDRVKDYYCSAELSFLVQGCVAGPEAASCKTRIHTEDDVIGGGLTIRTQLT